MRGLPLSWISLWTTVIPQRNWKRWLGKIWVGEGGGGGGGERCIMVYVKVVNVANDLSPKPSQEAKVSCHKIAKVNDCELLYSSMELKMRNCDQILKDMQLPT